MCCQYVLPTQMLAKLVEPSLDCRSVQIASGGSGAFDARTLCRRVIVPFDRANNTVLGGSSDPYVSKPVRLPSISLAYAGQQKSKSGWAALCLALDTIEIRAEPAYTKVVFQQTLVEIHRRLSNVNVAYPVPLRINLSDCLALLRDFLSKSSGGDRAQAVVSAAFRTFGDVCHVYNDVRRGLVNTADAASGQVADVECIGEAGDIVLAVEVKDQRLTVLHVQDKVPNMRSRHVSELIFLALRGVEAGSENAIQDIMTKEFASGQNIYVFDNLSGFLKPMLALLGERGRRQFLETVGQELDSYGSDISHRRAWAELLARA
ncbi:MAG: restriction endonuclease, SacI family [Ktedonobacterales bacterium]